MMTKILASLMCFFLLLQSSYALGLPYSDKVGAAVASLIAGKTSERVTGIALNSLPPAGMSAAIATQVTDPTYQKTIQVASFVATGILTAAIAAGTSPAWLVIALGTAAAVAVPLAINGAVSWLMNSDGTITSSGGAAPVDVALPPGSCWTYPGESICVGSKDAVASSLPCVTGWASSGGATLCYSYVASTGMIVGRMTPDLFGNGDMVLGAPTMKSGTPSAGGGVAVTSSVSSSIAALPAAELAKPANPQLIADLANNVWQHASATPGTIPFDSSHPILASDVAALQASNTAAYPMVGDLVSTGVNPATGSASMPIAGAVGGSQTGVVTGTQTSTTTNTATGSTTTTNTTSMLDWGTFIAPDLQVPVIESILDPLFNMFPSWKSFAFPSHASACPTPSFTLPDGVLQGRTVTFNQMCTFLEYSNTRTFMEAAFVVAWSILIIFIIMGA